MCWRSTFSALANSSLQTQAHFPEQQGLGEHWSCECVLAQAPSWARPPGTAHVGIAWLFISAGSGVTREGSGALSSSPIPPLIASSEGLGRGQARNVIFPVSLEGLAFSAWRYLRSPALLLLDSFGLFQGSCLASSKENQSLPGVCHREGSSPAVQVKLFLALAELENRLRAPELQR